MHIHSLKHAALAACLAVLAAAPAAVADSVPAELRVEATGGVDLTHNWTYYSDTSTLKTDTSEACGGTGQSRTFEGANALGILEHARRWHSRLDPLRVSDKFDFGMLVCGIGQFTASDSKFWTYKVNHVGPEVAAEQYPLKAGDDVLWSLQDINTGENTGNELELLAPDTVAPGASFEVTVNQYDFQGNRSPVEGAQVGGAVTDKSGKASVTFDDDAPSRILRAVHGVDIPSQPVRVCAGLCEGVIRKRLYGTSAADRISARGNFAEWVFAGGGDDRIDVRGGPFDRVRCGSGRDSVLADKGDRVARDCEKVTRR